MNMIDYGVVNYYQMNVCRSYTDFVLYKFGRGRGILLTEVHIIMRTSPACYRVMSFDQDQIMYRTCKTARDVCRYLIAEFIPEYVKPKSAKERRLELIERRKKLREELGDRARLGYMSGESWVICQAKKKKPILIWRIANGKSSKIDIREDERFLRRNK